MSTVVRRALVLTEHPHATDPRPLTPDPGPMLVIIGFIVVMGAVLVGFMGSGGHVGALFHPFEFLTIIGASFGALIIMSSKKALIDVFRGVLATLKGTPYNKLMYCELFKAMYEMLRVARRDGLMALDSHINEPHDSAIFNKYPRIAKNHHVTNFICGALAPIVEGTAKPEQLSSLLETEIKVIEEEHHVPITLLTKTADALPGFGIVAAVLGIVITMGAIDGPVEEIGHKVGAALVGTFLGILFSYGCVGPLAGRLELLGAAELAFFRTISSMVLGMVNDLPPKVAIEQARRGVGSEMRPTRKELDEMFKQVETA
jgi:chemotaxis protein MotA